MTLIGRPSTLRDLAKKIADLPVTARIAVMREAAGALTEVARGLFDAHLTVYKEPREAGDFHGAKKKKGRKRHSRGGHAVAPLGSWVSLVKSGTVRGLLAFTSYGTIARVVLSTKYARYLVGRYQILPNSQILPTAFRDVLASVADRVLRAEMGGA